jgi:hypothetical protein
VAKKRPGRPAPPLTVAQVLAWADAAQWCTGRWPNADSGAVAAAPGETWSAVNMALRQGLRGLPGGDSLARLLSRERGLRERRGGLPDRARHRRVARLRARGLTLTEIGRRLGVSRQRVSRILQGGRA